MLTLLHVEDSESMLKAVELMLLNKPIKLDSAMNGQKALDKVKENSFDAIVLDIDMPVMDGLEFLKQFQPYKGNTVVIVCSARQDVGSIYKAIELGAADYIMKPFTEDILMGKITQLGLI